MYILRTDAGTGKNGFTAVSAPFLDEPGLPFAGVLGAGAIGAAFAAQGACFGQQDIYSTAIVLWAFLAQVLRDGKGRACVSAVADIATYLHATGGQAPCGDTGDYCRARAKLCLPAVWGLMRQAADQLEQAALAPWLWKGLHAKLIDGFTFTMPDTPANQKEFPQPKSRRPGAGLPIARACGVLSLATAAIHDLAIGPYQGKETGESALLRGILESLCPGELAVFDRYFCSFMMLAMLGLRQVQFCTRLHQRRQPDFRRGKRLGKYDRLVTWTRPEKPAWMPQQLYARIPQTLTLRQLHFSLDIPGRRTQELTLVTSLTDPQLYSKLDIAQLYGFRWNVELDIRDIKQTLGLDHVRCKSPKMVRLELAVTLLAYNLIRKLIATAAAQHGQQPRHLGFTLACQTVLASWMILATGLCRDVQDLWRQALARIAANRVANRPGRIEPRALKRCRDRYPKMRKSRAQLRQELIQG